MIRSIIVLLLLAQAGIMARAQSTSLTPLQAEAQAAYEKGDYAAALALYDSIATDRTSAGLLFNIANCHFKVGDIPHAILFYERAQLLAPGDEDIQTNLDLARQHVVDRVNELPAFTLGSFWGRLRGGHDPDQWARRSLWAGLLFFALLSMAVLSRPLLRKRVLFGIAGVAFLAVLLCIIMAAMRHQEVMARDQAVIMVPKVDVKGEPRDAATVLFVLHEGSKVAVLQEQNGWSEVKLSNGSVGWMPPATLERI